MQLLHDRPATSDLPPAEAEVLIAEARAHQRRRWAIGSILVVCLLALGGGLYAISGKPPGSGSTAHGAGAIPPYFPGTKADETEATLNVADLLAPSAIAVKADGTLLIADSTRDQILQRTRSGRLSVFVGTGEVGSAGDGGNALDVELGRPGDIVLSRTGTLYLADTNDCRVRAITDGRIRTVTRGICNLIALAISPTGVLYASNGRAIYRIGSDERASAIAISSPDPRSGAGGSAARFNPCAFAFMSNGSLVAASGYYLVRLSPAGVMTPIEQLQGDCELGGIATAPNGDVLVTQRGAEIQEVTASGVMSDRTVQQSEVSGFIPSRTKLGSITWDIRNIAESSDGTIYAEAQQDAGYFPAQVTQLIQIPPVGRPSVLPITTPLSATLPKLGASGFPASVYPAPIASSGPGMKLCPSAQGLEPFGANAKHALTTMVRTLSGDNFFSDLKYADRSWWSQVFDSWRDISYPLPSSGIVSVKPASSTSLGAMVAADCGATLVQRSLVVATAVPPQFSSAEDPDPDLYVLDRSGHLLVYLQGP